MACLLHQSVASCMVSLGANSEWSSRCGGENHIHAGDPYIQKRLNNARVTKCTLWSTRLCPHPTIIKKMRTFLEVEGKMGPAPAPAPTPAAASQFRSPLPNTNPNIRKYNAMQRRGKRAAPKIFRPVASKPTATCTCPYQRSHPSPRMICQTIDQLQFIRSPCGLVQAGCQGTCLKRGTGYSHQTTWAITLKIKLWMNQRMQPVSQALDPHSKKKNQR